MATRKDLLKAHTFVTRRMVAALVDRDPDDIEAPLRRLGTGMFIGVMVAVLVTAGFGVVGLIRPGNSKNWKVDKTVIVDASSGGVLVYLQDKLYPTFNIASARLAAGGGDHITSVKSKSLQGFPREATIGIRKAPAQLPAPKDLNAYPMRTCSLAPPSTARDRTRLTTLELGSGDVPTGSTAFVARADGEEAREYLIADGVSYELPTHAIAIQLGFGEQQLRPGNAWLRSLPQGPPLRPLEIPGRGERSARPVAGADPGVGTVVHVDGAPATHYVLLRGGLAEVSPLEATVLELASGRRSQAIRATDANAARDPQQRSIGKPGMPATLPVKAPIPDPANTTACATWAGPGQRPRIAIGVPAPAATGQNPDPTLADQVEMPSLRGALVRNADASVTDPGVLVTEGRRYGIADAEAKAALGYAGVTPQPIDPQVLRLIPPGLDPGESLSIQRALQTG